MAKKNQPPKKVKPSHIRNKIHQASDMPRGRQAEGLLAKIAKVLRAKNQ